MLSLPGRRFTHNPYLRLFCDAFDTREVTIVDLRSRSGLLFRFDIVHVHFPEHYVSAQTVTRAVLWTAFYATYFLAAKLLGKRMVWTVHNVLPFQNRHPWLLQPWMTLFRRLVDAHVFLSRSSRAEFAERFPTDAGRPACMTSHGIFPVPPLDPKRREAWRALATPDGSACLVGFLGSIKQYKNIAALLALPASLSDGRRVQIVIAGTPDEASRADLVRVARDLGDRVTIIGTRVDDKDLDHLVRAMDVVFLPYLKGWNSGFATLVLGNRTKLLTSDLPMFQDLRDDVGPPWLSIYESPGDITPMLKAIVRQRVDSAANRRLDHFLQVNTFEHGATELSQFYRAIRKV